MIEKAVNDVLVKEIHIQSIKKSTEHKNSIHHYY